MASKKIILANKRRINTTDKAYVYTTSGYGGKVFSIARKMVIKMTPSEIKVNDVHSYPAVEYEITEWMFNKIKEDFLDKMNESHCIILN